MNAETNSATLTAQEQHLIGCLREVKGDEKFSLTIKREVGAWEINVLLGNTRGRGVGETFDVAWDQIRPTGLQFE